MKNVSSCWILEILIINCTCGNVIVSFFFCIIILQRSIYEQTFCSQIENDTIEFAKNLKTYLGGIRNSNRCRLRLQHPWGGCLRLPAGRKSKPKSTHQ